MRTQWPIFRDALLFLGGLGGVLHETAFTDTERPTLLILFAAMMGLPAFLRPNDPGPPDGGAGTTQVEPPPPTTPAEAVEAATPPSIGPGQ